MFNMFGFLPMLLCFSVILGEICYECKVNLTQRLEQAEPNCKRTVTNCTTDEICGSFIVLRDNSVTYWERCLDSSICANTSAVSNCPKETCYIFCCHFDNCNQYNKREMLPHIPYGVKDFFSTTSPSSSTTSPSSSTTSPSPSTTPTATCHTSCILLNQIAFLLVLGLHALCKML